MNESGTQGAQIPQTDAVDRVKHKTQTIALVTGVDLDEHKARQQSLVGKVGEAHAPGQGPLEPHQAHRISCGTLACAPIGHDRPARRPVFAHGPVGRAAVHGCRRIQPHVRDGHGYLRARKPMGQKRIHALQKQSHPVSARARGAGRAPSVPGESIHSGHPILQ